jgi:predicted acetyltransferase
LHDVEVAELALPTIRVRSSFLAAMAEFAAEGIGDVGDQPMVGVEVHDRSQMWSAPPGFAKYVAAVRADASERTPRPDGWVPSTTWWLLDRDEYLGRITLRHRLQ